MPSQHIINLLLVNAHSMLNAGDAALLEVSLFELKRVFQDVRFWVSSNYPHETTLADLGVIPLASPTYFARSPLSRSEEWQRLLTAYRTADIIISVPGNPFYSMGRTGWPFLFSAVSIYLAHYYHKPLYILPQTLGPFRRGWEISLIRSLYRRARVAFLRDQQSFDLAGSWGLTNIQLAVDPAWAFQASNSDQARSWLEQMDVDLNTPNIGVSVLAHISRTLNPALLDSSRTALARALDKIDARPVFFAQSSGPTQREDDREAARAVIAQLSKPQRAVLISNPFPAAQLKACYGLMDAFAAGRLHAGLFAVGMGVPTLWSGHFPKTRAVLETCGMGTWVIEQEEHSETMTEKMILLWCSRAKLRKELEILAANQAARVPKIYDLLADNFFSQ